MNRVYVARCPDYEAVGEKLRELLAIMGGLGRFIAAGERIILKPNLIFGAPPDKAVTTHPAVVVALGRLAKEEGASVSIVDSPAAGLPHTAEALRRTYRECGMAQAVEESGLDLCLDTRYETVNLPETALVRRFEIISAAREADGLINLPKFKTHTYLGMTGAVKNLYGLIPGRAKLTYHATLADPARFARMLLDLLSCVAPHLSIMDAVVGMEGDGPNAGTPRRVGLLLAAENPLALDVVVAEIMGLSRASNPLLLEAEKKGLQPTRIEEIELGGADLADLRPAGFRLPVTWSRGGGWDRGAGVSRWQKMLIVPWLVPLLKYGMAVRPRVAADKCVACGVCRDGCPAGAIRMIGRGRRKRARIVSRKCIRCYCCHEMCAARAVELREHPLRRILGL